MKPHWHKFLSLCLKAKNQTELSQLLDCFLTIEEKNDIADRYTIIQELLKEKLTQRDIALKYHVSIAKITRGSNALKSLSDNTIQFLKKNMVS
ncbi:MAG: Trp operon repressor [uncultured bacterium]|nr:MAG: Trp operon repressor [uncultured bacterium]OGT26248.1 MAG: Trp operon repressor [Gammaproteobacteria bacterium RIFCSPHIGHO2_02_FULL_42_43]OGT29322.1 MAG: Trp operon repressor [Gammaproteobacteria bacterium RIFCSPHIGHO2_01_FULL_42_8]OGT52625.1 MAG: Trp operon repressor [Gammaproteobacteria bacterium RIFCSPHIGHO2_12_FULL_41_25]OGT63223.1 MAG: Trp operon repressor [Gammaproteobacteria bacterium RIFCSPLOWO2_02_FULL_42_14]OGT86724.1 MAG: Trp operon repressor [Gammaproteobacteria bacterium R